MILPGAGTGAHPEGEVRGERPGVGIGVEGDARDHVDGEAEHAGPEDAVVQQLGVGLDLDDQAPLVHQPGGTQAAGHGVEVGGKVGHRVPQTIASAEPSLGARARVSEPGE